MSSKPKIEEIIWVPELTEVGPVATRVLRVHFRCGGHNWTAEFRGEPLTRVDLWRGVDWCGQWQWLGDSIGFCLQRGYHSRYVRPDVRAAAAQALLMVQQPCAPDSVT